MNESGKSARRWETWTSPRWKRPRAAPAADAGSSQASSPPFRRPSQEPLGVVVGGAVLSPGLARRESSWLPAGRLTNLPLNQPTPVMLRLERQDGYQRVIDRRAVYLVKTGSGVRALDSTCTHLGCRTRFNPETKRDRMPVPRRCLRREPYRGRRVRRPRRFAP